LIPRTSSKRAANASGVLKSSSSAAENAVRLSTTARARSESWPSSPAPATARSAVRSALVIRAATACASAIRSGENGSRDR
jgi:hypothetical protein